MTQIGFMIVAITAIGVSLSCTRGSSSAEVATTSLASGQDFPDPGVVKAKDGSIYAYATQTQIRSVRAPASFINIQAARSTDSKTWQYVGEVFPAKPTWASTTQNFWAPHVSFADGKYFMYFSAEADDRSGFCLGVATSDSAAGPFRDKGSPLVCGRGFQNIDPMAFDDPATGARLLYWGSGFGAIKVQELAKDRLSFAADSAPKDLLFPDSKKEDYRKLIEGAWITLHDGFYYLFFSGDDCCTIPHYAVMVARSQSATGPFEFKSSEWRDHIVVEAGGGYFGTGHNSVLEVEGKSKIFFHAMLTNDPKAPRVLVVKDLEWRDGWPIVR